MSNDIVYEVFVSYYGETGADNAERIRRVLNNRGYKTFVAHVDADNYVQGEFRPEFDAIIRGCKTFVILNTYGSLARAEVIRETMVAFPNGISDAHELIVFKDIDEQVKLGNDEFTLKTRIKLEDVHQIRYRDGSDLSKKIMEKCDSKKNLTREQKPPMIPPEKPHLMMKTVSASADVSPTFNYDALIQDAEHETSKRNFERAI
jgi:hypothetical protein